ncbi:ATP-binding protein [Nocardiopsis rhodophaea]|uniref:ATP-binding protein n=1 Tax=Nocardiopsis rhodophaea TaxID=280238 RepID=UPI0031CE9254
MFPQHGCQSDVTTLYLPGLFLGEVRTARDCVGCVLSREDPDICSTATLLTSELATNALIHGDTRNTACPKTGLLTDPRPFSVTVGLLAREIDVVVSGKGARYAAPRVRRNRAWDEDGRGLAWVEALSTTWGTYGDPESRTVWFSLDRTTAATPG